jgi:acyl carrier protein
MTDRTKVLTVGQVQDWLVEKVAARLSVSAEQIDVDQYFDELDLDSTEALVLSGELENWLGFELETTALWYHPTIAELAGYIVSRQTDHGAAAA